MGQIRARIPDRQGRKVRTSDPYIPVSRPLRQSHARFPVPPSTILPGRDIGPTTRLAGAAQHSLEPGEDEVRGGPLLSRDVQQPEMLADQVGQRVDGVPADFN